jgi:hypothetical protein
LRSRICRVITVIKPRRATQDRFARRPASLFCSMSLSGVRSPRYLGRRCVWLREGTCFGLHWPIFSLLRQSSRRISCRCFLDGAIAARIFDPNSLPCARRPDRMHVAVILGTCPIPSSITPF